MVECDFAKVKVEGSSPFFRFYNLKNFNPLSYLNNNFLYFD